MKILCSDLKVNISPYFMRPGFAFGGSCLPKDVRALRHLAKEAHVQSALLDAVLEANEAQIDRAETMVSQMGARPSAWSGSASDRHRRPAREPAGKPCLAPDRQGL